ncbi:hypothetical protein [Streptomyces sp. NPDC047014]|uniref:DUF6907 domain-containing protein n=1 Tax=Streptomyces sp. NPDC047014 TaxID=3155736 RepID=UPI0034004B37
MSNTVAARVKPAEADAPAAAPQTNDRTITIPLAGGGFMAVPCPSWCVLDHADDIERGLFPGELQHHGDKVSLPFTLADGTTIQLLCVRIEQWPYANDGDSDRPHAALVPSEGDGESTGYLTAAELHAEIRRVRSHLVKLGRLAERLAEARTEQHAAYYASRGMAPEGKWSGLVHDDVATMPVWYLLRVFEATVVEVDSPDPEVYVENAVVNADGSMTLNFDRRLTQFQREQSTRQLLANRLSSHR